MLFTFYAVQSQNDTIIVVSFVIILKNEHIFFDNRLINDVIFVNYNLILTKDWFFLSICVIISHVRAVKNTRFVYFVYYKIYIIY